MVGDTLVSELADPLSGLNGPSLFPRMIRASADAPVPAESKDLKSIHIYMQSLEAQIRNEKYALEKRISYLRLIYINEFTMFLHSITLVNGTDDRLHNKKDQSLYLM